MRLVPRHLVHKNLVLLIPKALSEMSRGRTLSQPRITWKALVKTEMLMMVLIRAIRYFSVAACKCLIERG